MSAEDAPMLDLRDPRQAGVYRVMEADVAALREVAAAEDVAVHDIDLHAVERKGVLIQAIYTALDFPEDWGLNWDALADGLFDLSWLDEAKPRLLVWHGLQALHRHAPDLDETLCGILEDASAFWAGEQIALWSLVCLEAAPNGETTS